MNIFKHRDELFNPPPRFIAVYFMQLNDDLLQLAKQANIDEIRTNNDLSNLQQDVLDLQKFADPKIDPQNKLRRAGSIIFLGMYSSN